MDLVVPVIVSGQNGLSVSVFVYKGEERRDYWDGQGVGAIEEGRDAEEARIYILDCGLVFFLLSRASNEIHLQLAMIIIKGVINPFYRFRLIYRVTRQVSCRFHLRVINKHFRRGAAGAAQLWYIVIVQ